MCLARASLIPKLSPGKWTELGGSCWAPPPAHCAQSLSPAACCVQGCEPNNCQCTECPEVASRLCGPSSPLFTWGVTHWKPDPRSIWRAAHLPTPSRAPAEPPPPGLGGQLKSPPGESNSVSSFAMLAAMATCRDCCAAATACHCF